MLDGPHREWDSQSPGTPGLTTASSIHPDTATHPDTVKGADTAMRRRVPRTSAGWLGSYRFEDGPGLGEGRCRVLDISVMGAGVEVFDGAPQQPVGHRLAVDVQAWAGGSVSIGLIGVVRNARTGHAGGLRLGMEFVGLSETERSVLDALEMMQAFW